MFTQSHANAPPAGSYARIDPDVWITELCKNDNAYRPLANYCNHETFLTAVRQKRHLLFDATGRQLLNTCGRIIGRLVRQGYRVHLVVVLSKRATCWERIEKRHKDTGRGVPGFIFNPTFDDMKTVVPVYLRGASSGLCETSVLCENELGHERMTALTPASPAAEVDAAVAAAEALLKDAVA